MGWSLTGSPRCLSVLARGGGGAAGPAHASQAAGRECSLPTQPQVSRNTQKHQPSPEGHSSPREAPPHSRASRILRRQPQREGPSSSCTSVGSGAPPTSRSRSEMETVNILASMGGCGDRVSGLFFTLLMAIKAVLVVTVTVLVAVMVVVAVVVAVVSAVDSSPTAVEEARTEGQHGLTSAPDLPGTLAPRPVSLFRGPRLAPLLRVFDPGPSLPRHEDLARAQSMRPQGPGSWGAPRGQHLRFSV